MKRAVVILMVGLLAQFSFSGLVGHWVLDDGSGSTAASAINSPVDDGTLLGDAAFIPGAVSLDGDGDAVQTSVGGVTGAGARTVAAWIKIEDDNYNKVIVSWGDSWAVGNLGKRFSLKIANPGEGAGVLRAEIGGGFAYGTTEVTDGTWHHVAVTTDAGDSDMSNVKFYIDGVLDPVAAFGNANPINSEAGQITIGGVISTPTYPDGNASMWFPGAMADARVYGETLSAAEIMELTKIRIANAPDPTVDGQNVEIDLSERSVAGELSWVAPEYTGATYDVYFGDTEPNFIETNYGLTKLTVSPTSATSIAPALPLVNLTPYYWVVDTYEPNTVGTILHPGAVWSFTTVASEPVIQVQPASETVPMDSTKELTVSGLNITQYQWYKDDEPVSDGGNVSGSMTSTLTIANAQLSDEGYYYCVVNNSLDLPQTSTVARIMIERLVAHWTLDGTLAAIESNPAENWDGDYMDPNEANPNPDDSLVNYVTGADGAANSAAVFDGNLFVEIPDSNEFFEFQRQGLTLTAWLFGSEGNGNYNRAVDKTGSYHLRQNDDGSLHTVMEGTGTVVTTAVPAAETLEGEWRFVALAYDPETGERVTYGIYDDDDVIDVLHTTTAAGIPNETPVNHLRIGGRSPNTNTQYFFVGSIDDVRIYNYALTASDIQEIYAEMTSNPLCMNNANPEIMPYDHNKDCQVNLEDFAAYAAAWLNSEVVLP